MNFKRTPLLDLFPLRHDLDSYLVELRTMLSRFEQFMPMTDRTSSSACFGKERTFNSDMNLRMCDSRYVDIEAESALPK